MTNGIYSNSIGKYKVICSTDRKQRRWFQIPAIVLVSKLEVKMFVRCLHSQTISINHDCCTVLGLLNGCDNIEEKSPK